MTTLQFSTANKTAFCVEPVFGPDGVLLIDGNGKITTGNGTLESPKPNAFSIVHIEDCPGSKPSCRAACYVHGLQQAQSDLFKLYRHNSREIRRILNSEHADDWSVSLGSWISRNCQGGFRWHVSGDIFSTKYARWIASVCRESPGVMHWIYTRSFNMAHPLATVATQNGGNLALNLSCDCDNWTAANAFCRTYGQYRRCYLTRDGFVPDGLPHGSVIFPDYSLRGNTEWFANLSPEYRAMVCPVDYHGKSETRRCGPCDRCLK